MSKTVLYTYNYFYMESKSLKSNYFEINWKITNDVAFDKRVLHFEVNRQILFEKVV